MNKNENLYVMNVLYTVAYIPNSISVIKKKKTHLMILACFVSFHVIMDVILYILKWIMLTPPPTPLLTRIILWINIKYCFNSGLLNLTNS